MGFPSFAYSLIAPSTGCRLFATEHSSNQFRLQAVFHSKTDDSKIHVVFVLEICKELLSGRQTFQAFASFYCRQTLTVSRTIIFLCQYKGTDSVLSRIQWMKMQPWRDQGFQFSCNSLFPIRTFTSHLNYLPANQKFVVVFFISYTYQISIMHIAFYVLCPNGYIFLKNTKLPSSSTADLFTSTGNTLVNFPVICLLLSDSSSY